MSKEKERTYQLEDLVIDACEELDHDWKEIQKGHYELDETIHEIADNSVPIYYWDIGQYAANNPWLMCLFPATNPDGNAHDQVQANIYEYIVTGLYKHIDEKKEKTV